MFVWLSKISHEERERKKLLFMQMKVLACRGCQRKSELGQEEEHTRRA